MADAKRRRQETQQELCAVQGDDVLVLDWTRDAAARCGREWLFNVMDGQHFVLCSELTVSCNPAGVKPFLQQLSDRGAPSRVSFTSMMSAAVHGHQWCLLCGQTLRSDWMECTPYAG